MNNDQIESLLRRARPQELPAGLKHRVLLAARQNAEPAAWAKRLTWASVDVCWMLIVLLRATTPTPSPKLSARKSARGRVGFFPSRNLIPIRSRHFFKNERFWARISACAFAGRCF